LAEREPASVDARAESFDLARLDAWMIAHVPGYAGPLELRRFSGGQSNPTFQLATPGARYVLRRKPIGRLLASAHAVDREHRVIAALYPTGFPVPRPYGVCEDESIAGSMFYVMEMADGRIFRDPTTAGLSAAERRSLWLDMIAVMARLHAFDPAGLGLGDFGRPGNYMARQIHRWTGQYRASETQRLETVERLVDWLPRTTPEQTRTSIVHGDFKLDNVVIHATAPRLAAVLDWELSTTGEPLADFSYLMMNWVNGPFAGPERERLGVPSLDECVAEYCRLTGREALPDLNWYFSYNLFRLACILQGIVGRARDGTANSPEAASMEARVPQLADAAWRFAERAGA
jgi:aminoglycoside phosphotransferase (APT) family kinase protein